MKSKVTQRTGNFTIVITLSQQHCSSLSRLALMVWDHGKPQFLHLKDESGALQSVKWSLDCGTLHKFVFFFLFLFFSLHFSQLPGRQFSLSDTWKKLSQHILLHYPFGISTNDHNAKY